MPRYYLTVHDDIDVIDEEGVELPDLAAAEAHARRGAAELIAEQVIAGKRINPEHRIEIEDEDRRPVSTLRFSDLIGA